MTIEEIKWLDERFNRLEDNLGGRIKELGGKVDALVADANKARGALWAGRALAGVVGALIGAVGVWVKYGTA